MNANILLRVSLRSLNKHKGRSFLTMLGIIIGIAAIIATLAIGKGAEEKMRQRFLSMGNNYVEIFAGNWYQEGKTTVKQRRRTNWFRFRDVEILQRLCPQAKHLSPVFGTKEVASFSGNNLLVTIKGGNEQFLKIIDRKIKQGIFFNNNHVKRAAKVAIIGAKSAKELFKTLNPIGKTIRIKNIPFTVIGVTKKMENYQGVHDPNFDIIIPAKALKKHLHNSHDQVIHSIIMSANTKEEMPHLVHHLRKIMRFRHKIQDGEPDDFTIIDQASIIKAAQSGAETVSLLLLIIASISLLVGGIGIMNIMLVSVTERTKEIGIRMALGANTQIILQQFLIEALTLCFIGGLIGVVLGITVPYALASLTSWNPIITPNSIIVAFLSTSSIGIFFGYYPARKASRLNPVNALEEH